MLPVYTAISFQRVLEKGGRTKPWLILVNTGEAMEPYVVKLFETALIEEKDSVANEVIGNVLAKEFQLPVPNAAFIEMNVDFINILPDPKLREVLAARDNRIKFGSALLDGFARFDAAAISLWDARKMIEIDNLFAFDNLIRNPDRNIAKPNILIKSDQAYIIDHELGFEITDKSIEEMEKWQWKERFYKYHIFYPYLKNSSSNFKKDYFSEFEEHLKYLNINLLLPYFEQLSYYGFSQKNHSIIIDYLSHMKRKSINFVNLRGLIS